MEYFLKITSVYIMVLLNTRELNADRILCLTPPLAGVGSHLSLMATLCDALAQDGHVVTLLIQGPGTAPPSNMTVLRHTSVFSREDTEKFAGEFSHKSQRGTFGIVDLIRFVDRLVLECRLLMSDNTLFEKLQASNFTMAIVDHFYFCGVLLAQRLHLPYIALDTAGYFSAIDSGVPLPLSYVPMYNSQLTNQMNFWERTVNILAYLGSLVMFKIMRNPFLEIGREYNITGTTADYFTEAELWLLNTDFSLEFPRPVLPNMVYIGGCMAKEAKALDEPFRSLLGHYDEAIVVSFGNFFSSLIPTLHHHLNATFLQLSQLVIWKQNTTMKLSDNVHAFEWIPQNDLIGHLKTKLLVSHCGMNSVMEAIYHAVPVLCIPFQGDQIDNSVRVKAKGFGLTLSPQELTSTNFQDAIKQILTEERFKKKVRRLSGLYHFQPHRPLERAVFAVNRAVKNIHYNEENVEKRLSVIQYYMIDSWCFLSALSLFVISGVTFTFIYMLKIVWISLKLCILSERIWEQSLSNKKEL